MQVSASLSPSLCSYPACKSLRLTPRPRAQLCLWTGEDLQQLRVGFGVQCIHSVALIVRKPGTKFLCSFTQEAEYSYLDTILAWGWNLLVIILNLSPMMNTLVEKLRKS